MKARHDDFFEDYIRSFTFNLENIWKESSARELTKSHNKKIQNSAIVIGRGPSLKKNHHKLNSINLFYFFGKLYF